MHCDRSAPEITNYVYNLIAIRHISRKSMINSLRYRKSLPHCTKETFPPRLNSTARRAAGVEMESVERIIHRIQRSPGIVFMKFDRLVKNICFITRVIQLLLQQKTRSRIIICPKYIDNADHDLYTPGRDS